MGAAIAVVAPMLMGGGGLMGGLMGGMGGGGILSQILAGILGGAGGSGGAEGIGKAMQGFAPANVLNATANLVSSMLGNSTKDAARTLHREDGMPKFVMDAINNATQLPKGAEDLKRWCESQLERHEAFIRENLEDMPEVRDWKLGAEV